MEEIPNLVEVAKSKEPDAVEVKVDGRKYTSVYNAMRHGKYASVPLLCNICQHRAKTAGGSGRCNVYEIDSACNIRNDLRSLIEKYNTRNPDTLRSITNDMIQILTERVVFAEQMAVMSDDPLDKQTLTQANVLAKYIKLQSELGTASIKVTKETQYDNTNEIKKILDSLTIGKVG